MCVCVCVCMCVRVCVCVSHGFICLLQNLRDLQTSDFLADQMDLDLLKFCDNLTILTEN